VVTGTHTWRIYVLDRHAIFRRGMETCLEALTRVSSVDGASTAAEAWAGGSLAQAHLVLADCGDIDGLGFIRRVREELGIPVIACSPHRDEDSILAAVEAGATGVLAKDSITPESLSATVEAALRGGGVMSPELLGVLLSGINRASRETLAPRGLPLSRLTTREQQVLRLIADGCATREVAYELSYSERTVKNVLHDVTTKLGVRSRSHAVAFAVREGLI
jgi:DNA-binding NarL/FixJ family response regulator